MSVPARARVCVYITLLAGTSYTFYIIKYVRNYLRDYIFVFLTCTRAQSSETWKNFGPTHTANTRPCRQQLACQRRWLLLLVRSYIILFYAVARSVPSAGAMHTNRTPSRDGRYEGCLYHHHHHHAAAAAVNTTTARPTINIQYTYRTRTIDVDQTGTPHAVRTICCHRRSDAVPLERLRARARAEQENRVPTCTRECTATTVTCPRLHGTAVVPSSHTYHILRRGVRARKKIPGTGQEVKRRPRTIAQNQRFSFMTIQQCTWY